MLAPSPLERQVRQNANDVLAIYELVHGIDRKISALDVAVSTVVGTQLRHGQRLDVIDDKLEQVSGELTETRTEMAAKLEQVSGELTETKVEMRAKLEQVSGEMAEARTEMNAKLEQVLALLRGQ
ncbi:MAG: hypothetical protein ACRDR6_06090 [Pseudonocardiaceae bacterium]